jgi:hypothetical protein
MSMNPPRAPDARDAPDDPDAPPTEEELAAAESLREALEGRAVGDRDAELARAIRHAVAPRPIDVRAHEAIVERTVLARARRLRWAALGSATIAIAAAVVIYVGVADRRPADVAAAPQLVPARSTAPLFHEPFPRSGATSSRVDRIALARARDLRDNEFSRWGVR